MRSRSLGAGSASDPAHPWIQTHGDALDRAALAGGIASLEEDDHFLTGLDHPILQLDQLRLQPKEFAEVAAPIVLLGVAVGALRHAGQRMGVLDLQFQFFVVTVGDIAADAANHFFTVEGVGHCRFSVYGDVAPCQNTGQMFKSHEQVG